LTRVPPSSLRNGPAGLLAWSRFRGGLIGALAAPLGGCVAAGAPSLSLFGAYFPSWLACALAGILGAVIVRVIFIRAGIDDILPVRLPVYVAIAAGIGFLVSLSTFGR